MTTTFADYTVHLDTLNPLNPRIKAIVEDGTTDTRYANHTTYFIKAKSQYAAVVRARAAVRNVRARRDRSS